MASLLLVVGAFVLLAMLSLTKEQRSEARERMKPISRALLPFVIAAWAWIIAAVYFGWERR